MAAIGPECSIAEALRSEMEQARLDQLGGEPLKDSGFEAEQYELDFDPQEEEGGNG